MVCVSSGHGGVLLHAKGLASPCARRLPRCVHSELQRTNQAHSTGCSGDAGPRTTANAHGACISRRSACSSVTVSSPSSKARRSMTKSDERGRRSTWQLGLRDGETRT